MQAPCHSEGQAASNHGRNSSSAVRNADACATTSMEMPRNMNFQHLAGNNDSKRINTTALALDLASGSLWSDAFSLSTAPTQEVLDEDLPSAQRLGHYRSHIPTEDIDIGPPPAYSSSCEHDLTTGNTEPETVRQTMTQRAPPASDNLEHGTEGSGYGDNPNAPLLDESNEKSPSGWYPWMRANSTTDTQQHRSWQLHAVLVLLLISILGSVLGYLHGGGHKSRFQQDVPKISTSPVHAQHQTYQDIRGRFELYDRLELSTTTGSIDIQIDPQPGNGTSELILSTSTGGIKLGISDSWWMRKERSLRPIHTEIRTVQGSVYGRILLGNGGYASVDSVTGAQDLRVYMYEAGVDNQVSELITRSHIGNQVVALTNFGGLDSTISSLKAEHRSLGTANLDLQYSHAWKGEIHAVCSAVGRLEVQGDGRLVFDKKDEHEVLAHKGQDTHRNTVDVISDGTGSICFKAWYTW